MRVYVLYPPVNPYRCMSVVKKPGVRALDIFYDAFIKKYPANTCSELVNGLAKLKLQDATRAYLAKMQEMRKRKRELLRSLLK